MPRGLNRILIGSAVVHGVLLLGVAVSGWVADRPAPEPVKFIPTKLVKLGQKRAKELLPTVERQAPPPPKPQVAVQAAPPQAPTTAAKPAPAQSAVERAKEMTKVSGALDRLKRMGKPDNEGDPDGVEEGEVTDAQKAIVGNKYVTEIYQCMKSNFTVEGVDRNKVKGREVLVLVRVRPDGKLFGTEILTKSGLPAFDRSVERAIHRCGKVSKPPDILRDMVGKDGIEILFKPQK